MFDLFGLTETGSCDFCLAPSDQPQGLGTIGKPTENVAFRIAADGASGGELQIKTPYGMLGYLDNPALTESAFSDGFFCTGDLARLREDGRVELVGRAKEIVSRAGHKIAPLEIDGLLAEHPDVAAALTAGVPDAQVGERLHVVVVARPGAALDEAALRAWAAERIERYKLPDAFHFRDALPLGRTGKADRGAVASLVQETTKCGREIQP
jgi:acyl-coenzyme A synthetase/AMP-(fatty) acid ligase